MEKNIAVILGDGIGPELTQQAIKVLDGIGRQFKHSFYYKYGVLGADASDKKDGLLSDSIVQLCLESDAILAGATGQSKIGNNQLSLLEQQQGLLDLKKELGLFTNIRPITTYSSLHHLSPLKSNRLEGVNFIIFRELTSGTYSGSESVNEDSTEASDDYVYHTVEIEKAAHFAFSHARKRRKVLTLVDKANMRDSSRLWRRIVQALAAQYSDVTVDYMSVNDAAMQIIINPKQFDVILTENMFGDIISNEASVINGSPGLLPSASVGDKHAMFEPAVVSNPKAIGKNIANPIGSILSSAMLLEYFELYEEADLIREAVEWTLTNGFVTKDIDVINNYSIATIGDLVTDYVENRIPSRMNKENMVISKSTII